MAKVTDNIKINWDDIKIRKKFAPPTQVHNPKKAYTRKPKYGDSEVEEGLEDFYFESQTFTLEDLLWLS